MPFVKIIKVDVETLCEDLFDKLGEVKVEFLGVKMLDVALHALCDTMVHKSSSGVPNQ